jgi:oxygen-independent coproporphyrinogen-3 oxidase
MYQAAIFDPDLVRRYDRPGPRYTSYPSAPLFNTNFGEPQYLEQARRSNQELIPHPLSLYVHVPYCASPCFYCGCNRVITRDPAKGRVYLERLLSEIELVAPLFDRDRPVMQLHFGGGTPNFLAPEQLAAVVERLGERFSFGEASRRDFSIELDPRHVHPGDIAAYARAGFNRASIGVQDFDPDVQRAVNRIQSVEETAAVIDDCRQAAFRSVNVDLIYGLPRQTCAGFERTLDTVVELRPDRLAVYGYAHLPALFKAQRPLNAEDLPDAETRLRLLGLAVDRLTAAGYCYIGMDHFALPGDDLAIAQSRGGLHRNFMGYTTHAECDLVGLGVSAISRIGDSYSQNRRDLPAWEGAVDTGRLPVWRGLTLSFDDVVRADVIMQLMCSGEIDLAAVERRFGIEFLAYFAATLPGLRRLADDGLLLLEGSRIVTTARGRFLLRVIAMAFDRYLESSPARDSAPRHSRVI